MSDHEGFGAGYVSPDPEYAVTPPGAGYEHTDAHVWIIVKFGLWLVISAAIIHVGVVLMFGLFVDQRESAAVPQFPLAVGSDLRLPVEPRLQRFPANEAYTHQMQEQNALRTYGWVDRNAGTVRIPIEDAMRLTVERGLPSRAAAATDAALPDAALAGPALTGAALPGTPADAAPAPAAENPSLMPADSSSGRTMERRRQ